MFSAYGTFMLRQFFLSLPRELEDAALIDGASLFGIYWNVIMPLSKPALAALTTFVFLHSWNDFMWPLIVIDSLNLKTLPIGLAHFQGPYLTEWNLLMAASVIVMVPVADRLHRRAALLRARDHSEWVEGVRTGL